MTAAQAPVQKTRGFEKRTASQHTELLDSAGGRRNTGVSAPQKASKVKLGFGPGTALSANFLSALKCSAAHLAPEVFLPNHYSEVRSTGHRDLKNNGFIRGERRRRVAHEPSAQNQRENWLLSLNPGDLAILSPSVEVHRSPGEVRRGGPRVGNPTIMHLRAQGALRSWLVSPAYIGSAKHCSARKQDRFRAAANPFANCP